jgi:hypothetical protein
MAREGRAQRRVRELDREENIDKSWTYDHHGSMSLLPPARSWLQRLPWRWSIAELRTSPALTPRNCLAITLPASNRQSRGRRIIPWTADPATSTPRRSTAPPIPGISPGPNNRCSVPTTDSCTAANRSSARSSGGSRMDRSSSQGRERHRLEEYSSRRHRQVCIV